MPSDIYYSSLPLSGISGVSHRVLCQALGNVTQSRKRGSFGETNDNSAAQRGMQTCKAFYPNEWDSIETNSDF